MPPRKSAKKKASPPDSEPDLAVLAVGTVPGRKEAAERRRVADEELARSVEGKSRKAKENALKNKTWLADAPASRHKDQLAQEEAIPASAPAKSADSEKAPKTAVLVKKIAKDKGGKAKASSKAQRASKKVLSIHSDCESAGSLEEESASSSAKSSAESASKDEEEDEEDEDEDEQDDADLPEHLPRFIQEQNEDEDNGIYGDNPVDPKAGSLKGIPANQGNIGNRDEPLEPHLSPPPSAQPSKRRRPKSISEDYDEGPRNSDRRSKGRPAPSKHAQSTTIEDSDSGGSNMGNDDNKGSKKPDAKKPKKAAKKKKPAPSIRAAKFAAEKPTFSKGDGGSSSEDEVMVYPAVTHLVKSEDQRLLLKKQSPIIFDLLHAAFDLVARDLVFSSTWPEGEELVRHTYGKRILLSACQDAKLVKRHGSKSIDAVATRIKGDLGYMKDLSRTVLNRLPNFRTVAKLEAKTQVARYKLGLDNECKARVDSLLFQDKFHFPGTWGTAEGEENVWKPVTTEGFTNPAILLTLKNSCFATAASLGYKYTNEFVSSIPENPFEKEMPKAMVALAMTAVYARLKDLSSGSEVSQDFAAGAFAESNQRFFKMLDSAQARFPVRFHNRMHEIFKFCAGNAAASSSANDTANMAVELFDFV